MRAVGCDGEVRQKGLGPKRREIERIPRAENVCARSHGSVVFDKEKEPEGGRHIVTTLCPRQQATQESRIKTPDE